MEEDHGALGQFTVTTNAGDAFTESRPGRRLGRGLRRRRRLRVGLTQLIYLIAGLALGLIVPHIPVGFTVPRGETAQMLFAVGAGLVTFIGVVFSLLYLVVEFAATTFTPRLNVYYRAPIVWHAFAFYVGVLVYTFVAAFALVGNGDRVTGLIPIVTVVLLLLAVFLYRSLQMRGFESITLSSVLADIAERGRLVLDGVYPDEPLRDVDADEKRLSLPAGGHDIVWQGRPGVLQAIDVPRIIAGAHRAEAAVEFVVGMGEPLYPGRPVAVVRGDAGPELDTMLLGAMRAGKERTFEQDPMLAFRLLVDIALRAISPAVYDPTTAAQVLDTLEGLLRALVGRELDVNAVTGPRGHVRVVLLLPAWEEYVALSFEELIAAGAGILQVRRRMERLLRELLTVAPESRRAPLTKQLELLESGNSMPSSW